MHEYSFNSIKNLIVTKIVDIVNPERLISLVNRVATL